MDNNTKYILIRRRVDPPDKVWETCHGCCQHFRPRFLGNTRCPDCTRMARVSHHQKLVYRGHEEFKNHSCPDCKWALKRGYDPMAGKEKARR